MAKFKVIIITGEPATGKSTLVKKVFNPEEMEKIFSYRKLKGHTDGRIFVGGIYNGELFEGTDKLSMAVQPDAVEYVNTASKHYKDGVLVMEGDRVANAKFLNAMAELEVETHLVILKTDEKELADRHIKRGDTQAERWLRSRRTKVNNLHDASKVMPHVKLHVWENQNAEQCGLNADTLKALTLPSQN